MNLSVMSFGELQKLFDKVKKEIDRRSKTQRGQALSEIKTIAAKYGLKLDDVIGKPVVRASRKAMRKGAKKPAKKAAAIRYRHPQNPSLTWGGGRGRRPQWIKEWEAAGHTLDEARAIRS